MKYQCCVWKFDALDNKHTMGTLSIEMAYRSEWRQALQDAFTYLAKADVFTYDNIDVTIEIYDDELNPVSREFVHACEQWEGGK